MLQWTNSQFQHVVSDGLAIHHSYHYQPRNRLAVNHLCVPSLVVAAIAAIAAIGAAGPV